jgi:hypothetical protein
MAKPQGSLESMMRARVEAKPAPSGPGANASTVVPIATPTPAPEAPAKVEKVSLYIPRAAYKFIKQTALDFDKKPHDLLIEGVEMVLAKHGKSLKDFQDAQR